MLSYHLIKPEVLVRYISLKPLFSNIAALDTENLINKSVPRQRISYT